MLVLRSLYGFIALTPILVSILNVHMQNGQVQINYTAWNYYKINLYTRIILNFLNKKYSNVIIKKYTFMFTVDLSCLASYYVAY